MTQPSIWWMPPDGALHGPAIDRLMFWNLSALTALFLLSHVAFLFLLFRPALKVPANNAGAALKPEYALLLILALLYAWMAVTANRLWGSIGYQGPAPQALHVEVTGVQFQWYFRYPGADDKFGTLHPELVNAPAGNPLGIDATDPHSADDFISSILVLPVGREADLLLRSTDVIHGFFIPGMRLKQNTVPGMPVHIHFTPSVIGDYSILCSQVCGSGHARMQTRLSVVSQADYDKWFSKHVLEATR